ncbi:nuclear transport factor 2 family protein [Leptospira stimsonii]|uniref:Nuclear transport factor 2 family protein n=1 Tax=Leptospira stimsonii TaxID=2202203 RepID=A0ABY2MUM7_9LEPT|nr:nuclear transport factor 2 family protein [Leptospira stimsonii]TGK25238.1 nuclear transport factor 2 family protein [Leptospira stimsonii]TGM08657.1 nuclear transport factor 2 family protein [Leptospira stimsonii]
MTSYKKIIEIYLKLLSDFNLERKEYEAILHPEIEQIEYPNALTKSITVSRFEDLMRRMPAGKNLLKEQTFQIRQYLEKENTAVVEADWEATVRSDLGPFRENQNLKAYLCMIFEFKDEKIFRQKNYDCFEPFG